MTSELNRGPARRYLQRGDGPIVLVMAPTRELAVQIKEECDKSPGLGDRSERLGKTAACSARRCEKRKIH